jgi:hypothetical protein
VSGAYREDERHHHRPHLGHPSSLRFAETSRRDKAVFGFNSKARKLFLTAKSPSTPSSEKKKS